MSFRQKLTKYLDNHAETRENHQDSSLQTRYYKTTKDKGLKMLENYFRNSPDYKLNAVSSERGEISVITNKGRKAFIVVTVIMVRPFFTAIDFSVTTETVLPIDFGFSTKVIHQLYDQVNKELIQIDDIRMGS
ncbi:cytosolic protein [Virgibacillus byunsanensis]|uniref:Cytosolic protein n=1 Tax=Virgibacillus byunsanensis TaxID=570945 RepID=A0ABW3LJI6_9BACI